jgi:hypothetical protein
MNGNGNAPARQGHPLYRSGWQEVRAEYGSYPDFIEYVERVQKSSPGP